MVDPLSYFLFQPVLYDWYKEYSIVCVILIMEMVYIKEPLMLIGKSSSSGGSMFPLTLWSIDI